MKLASIVPVQNIGCAFDGDYAMLLAHLAQYYPTHHPRFNSCYRIMDNSLIELGGACDMHMLTDAAERCDVNEIVLPDVFKNSKGTLDAVYDALTWLDQHGKVHKWKLMAVCQGDNAEDFEKCFRTLERFNEISCIGIPKVTDTLHPRKRPGFEYLWQGSPKNIHLLGCWYGLGEVFKYEHPESIRSIDTCIPALNSIYGRSAWESRPDERTIDLINDQVNGRNYANILNELRAEGLL